MSERTDRVGVLIKETLSEIIRREVKDPRVEWATITKIKVSPDLRSANVYVSTIKGDEKLSAMIDALNKMRHFLQNKLNENIRLKYIPVLNFFADKNVDYAFDIQKKLEEIVPEPVETKDEPEE